MKKGKKPKRRRRRQEEPHVSSQHVPSNDELKAKLNELRWGKSKLSNLIDMAHKNTLISYVLLNSHFNLLENTLEIFEKSQNLISVSNPNEMIVASFLTRAHSNFVASVRLGTSGQLTESYALLRLCLENTLYAFYMHKVPTSLRIWDSRQTSEKDRKLCRSTFKIIEMIKELKKENPQIADSAKHLYDKCIDYGAHPNLLGVIMNVTVLGEKILERILNPEDGLMRFCLLLETDVALTTLSIFSLVYPTEFNRGNIPIMIENVRKTFFPLAITAAQILRSQASKN